jgi:hypothetical protein
LVTTLAELQATMQAVTRTITGIDGKKVRIAYQQDNQPSREIDQDIIYLSIKPVDNLYDKQIESVYDPDYEINEFYYTRVMECTWSCFGPDSFQNADLIRFSIVQDAIRAALRPYQIFPVPGIVAPDRVQYLFQGQWWERSDLRVLLYVLTLRTISTAYFLGAEINLYDEDGLQRVANISE